METGHRMGPAQTRPDHLERNSAAATALADGGPPPARKSSTTPSEPAPAGTQALVAAFADDKSIVDESSARAAVAEVTAE
jgi:hypothetical protein